MAALIHAKNVKGKKVWYVYGARGDAKWEHHYPHCRSRAELYQCLRTELELPSTASDREVVFALFSKTRTPDGWIDDFALQLRAHRQKKNMTQAELAEKAGLHHMAIAALEQGKRSPTLDTVRRIAFALELSVNQFSLNVPQK